MFGAPSGAQDPAEADRLQRQQQVALQTSKEKEEELQRLLQRLSRINGPGTNGGPYGPIWKGDKNGSVKIRSLSKNG